MQRSGFRSKLVFRLFLLFTFLIPVSQYLSSAALVLCVIMAALLENRIQVMLDTVKRSWDMVLYLLILTLGLMYSDDKETGFHVLETSLSLLAVPIVISRVGDFGKDRMKKVFLSFTAGLLVASLICLGHASYKYVEGNNTEVFFFYQFTGVIDSHPTYFAYYLIAAITYGLHQLYYEKPIITPVALVLILLFLFGILLLTGGITAFVSMLFVFAFFVLKFLLEERTRKHTAAFFVVVTMVAGMFAFNELRHRDPSGFVVDDSWDRMVLWESALKANPNTFLGVGTGDYKSELNAYYTSHGMSAFADSNMNAHNQFIETYFANGLLGLVCLLLLLIRPVYLSVRNGNALGALIFFPFIIYGITEVFLGRYQGVVFFALMQQCFVAFYQSYKPSFSLKRA